MAVLISSFPLKETTWIINIWVKLGNKWNWRIAVILNDPYPPVVLGAYVTLLAMLLVLSMHLKYLLTSCWLCWWMLSTVDCADLRAAHPLGSLKWVHISDWKICELTREKYWQYQQGSAIFQHIICEFHSPIIKQHLHKRICLPRYCITFVFCTSRRSLRWHTLDFPSVVLTVIQWSHLN